MISYKITKVSDWLDLVFSKTVINSDDSDDSEEENKTEDKEEENKSKEEKMDIDNGGLSSRTN